MTTTTEQIYAAQIDRHRDHLALLRAEGAKEIAWETAYKLYYLLSQALKEERGA